MSENQRFERVQEENQRFERVQEENIGIKWVNDCS